MIVYLGDASTLKRYGHDRINALFNYYLIQESHYAYFKGKVICDSGAFSFMTDPKRMRRMDIDEYCDNYCEFIKKHDVTNFFELDVDTLLGVDKARGLRSRIEKNAKRRPIPVWHRERGKKGWEEMCDDYDYVALPLSGKNDTSQWIAQDDYRRLWWLVNEAHKRGARIHALGLGMNQRLYKRGAFFSCDSVAYLSNALYGGGFNYFEPTKGIWRKSAKSKPFRYNTAEVLNQSLAQWKFFSEWAEANL